MRQKLAAKAIVENLQLDNPKHLGEVLESVGYPSVSAETPARIIESLGFKQALYDLGLTEELISSALVEDIEAKPANRVQELRLGAQILKMVDKPEPVRPTGENTTYNFIFSKPVQEDVREIEDRIKAKLLQKHVAED